MIGNSNHSGYSTGPAAAMQDHYEIVHCRESYKNLNFSVNTGALAGLGLSRITRQVS